MPAYGGTILSCFRYSEFERGDILRDLGSLSAKEVHALKRHLWSRVAGAAVAAGALVLASHTAASADTARPSHGFHLGNPPVYNINATADGFTLPTSIHAGLVTFSASTNDIGSHGIQGFYLRPGVTLAKTMSDLNDALSGDPNLGPAGIVAVNKDLVDIGGISTTTYAPQAFTAPLFAGTYYFVDLSTVANPPLTPVVHTLHVVGGFRLARLPSIGGVVGMTDGRDGMPIFTGSKTLPAKGNYFAYATGDDLHESVIRPAVAGTTDEYLDAYYKAIVDGTPRPPSPWAGGSSGLQAISPGRWVIMHTDLPPGLYALLCYVPSDDPPGLPHAYMGMHRMVTLK